MPAREFVSVDASVLALVHARVIDGTGAPGRSDQTVVIRDGIIVDVGDTRAIQPPPNARVIDLNGRTILPGYVMLHEHMFMTPNGGGIMGYTKTPYSFAPLYLAGGATTVRTAGSLWWPTDRKVRDAIEAGEMPGPTI